MVEMMNKVIKMIVLKQNKRINHHLNMTQKKIRNVMIQIISKTIRKITIIKNELVIKIQMLESNEQAKDQQQIQTEIHRIIKINNSNQYKITRINMQHHTKVKMRHVLLDIFLHLRATAVKLCSNYQILKLHFPLPKMKLICMEAKINHIMIIQQNKQKMDLDMCLALKIHQKVILTQL